MNGSTDMTIEIECSECDEIITGVDAMVVHILDKHPTYSAIEAANYARIWADDAYEKQEEFLADYHKQRKEDPSE